MVLRTLVCRFVMMVFGCINLDLCSSVESLSIVTHSPLLLSYYVVSCRVTEADHFIIVVSDLTRCRLRLVNQLPRADSNPTIVIHA